MNLRTRVTVAAGLVAVLGLGLSAQQPPAGAAPGGPGRGRGPQTPPLLMTSSAWEDGGVIPDKYTQAAGPTAPSPELKWSQVPMGTQSFVLLMHDPEPVLNKGSKMDITHWLIWNIPGTATGLAEGTAQGDLPGRQPPDQPPIQWVHGSGRPGRTVSPLHVRAVRARYEAGHPLGHASTSGRHAQRRRERNGWSRARKSGASGEVPSVRADEPCAPGTRLRLHA